MKDTTERATVKLLSAKESTAHLIRNAGGYYMSESDPATPGALRCSRNPASMARRYTREEAESVAVYLWDDIWQKPAGDKDVEIVEVRVIEIIKEVQR